MCMVAVTEIPFGRVLTVSNYRRRVWTGGRKAQLLFDAALLL